MPSRSCVPFWRRPRARFRLALRRVDPGPLVLVAAWALALVLALVSVPVQLPSVLALVSVPVQLALARAAWAPMLVRPARVRSKLV